MRALPPTKANLEKIHKIVMTLQDLDNEQEVEWPKPPPFKFFTPDGFSLMLDEVSQKWKNYPYALRKLSPEERRVVAGLPTYSQWKNRELAFAVATPQQDERDAISDAEQKLNAAELFSRFKEIKRDIKRPVVPTAFQSVFGDFSTICDEGGEDDNNNENGEDDDDEGDDEYDSIFDASVYPTLL